MTKRSGSTFVLDVDTDSGVGLARLARELRRAGSPGRRLARSVGFVQALDVAYVFPYALDMKTMTASVARANLYRLLDETAESSEPVQITGKKGNAVLVSERDWRAMQETMYLLSIPGMRESIREGLATPIEECSEDPGW
jgi:prevent-host-death family protein